MKENKENINNTKNNNSKKKKSKLWIVIVIIGMLIVGGIIVYKTVYENVIEVNDIRNFYVDPNYTQLDKPIIYLYPEEKTDISVKLGNPEKLKNIYPSYNDGWDVTAYPNGTLIDEKTGREYYSLYYECNNTKIYKKDLEEGFVVKKENIISFLEEKLDILGLNNKEAQEFIIYWLPRLQQNDYIYIRFQTMKEIEENMPLYISQTPDTLIRIMMEWKGLKENINIKEQTLKSVNRSGFTVVEWGGTEIE